VRLFQTRRVAEVAAQSEVGDLDREVGTDETVADGQSGSEEMSAHDKPRREISVNKMHRREEHHSVGNVCCHLRELILGKHGLLVASGSA
jgi:hypothetical protein